MSEDLPQSVIAEAARGDRVAAGQVLRSVLPRVRNLVRYLIRGDGEVDDIAQQCLVAILQGLPQYRGEGTFRAWADRITARRTFAEIRKVRKAQAAWSGLSPDLTVVATNEDYLRRRQVVQLLDRLPDAQRQAVVLHHAAGFTVAEIAEVLDVPFDTVKSRIRLGLKKLRALEETKV